MERKVLVLFFPEWVFYLGVLLISLQIPGPLKPENIAKKRTASPFLSHIANFGKAKSSVVILSFSAEKQPLKDQPFWNNLNTKNTIKYYSKNTKNNKSLRTSGHVKGLQGLVYRTTNAVAGVGIGLKGGFHNLIKKAIISR